MGGGKELEAMCPIFYKFAVDHWNTLQVYWLLYYSSPMLNKLSKVLEGDPLRA